MYKLDNEFLTTLGLGGLPVDEKNRLLQMIYERLEMNVGMRLAEKMTDAQLDEFEGFIDRNDEPGALKWLEANFPNYKDVVAEELEKLKVEVKQAAPQILAAAQTTLNNPQPSAYPAQPQQYPQAGYPQQPQMGAPMQPQQPTAADLMSYQQPQVPPMYQNSAMPPQQPMQPQPQYQQYSQPAPQQPQYQAAAPQFQPAQSVQPQPLQPATPAATPAPAPAFPTTTPVASNPVQPATPPQPAQPSVPPTQQFTPPPAGFSGQ